MMEEICVTRLKWIVIRVIYIGCRKILLLNLFATCNDGGNLCRKACMDCDPGKR